MEPAMLVKLPPLPTIVDPRHENGAHGGVIITSFDLPCLLRVNRWTWVHKAIAVMAVRKGLISQDKLFCQFGVLKEEFLSWERAYQEQGIAGLRSCSLLALPGSCTPVIDEQKQAEVLRRLGFDAITGTIILGNRRVRLSRRQDQVLSLLAGNAERLVTKKAILTFIYGDKQPDQKILDVFVSGLRKKLAHGVTIETIWSRGYVLHVQ